MRFCTLFTLFIAAVSAIAQANSNSDDLAPPDLLAVMKENASSSSTSIKRSRAHSAQQEDGQDEITDSNAPAHPNIRVTRKADATMEEYSFNGKLYMVKVTPKIGKPYYLYDEEGTGKLTHRDDSNAQIAPPRWTLFSW